MGQLSKSTEDTLDKIVRSYQDASYELSPLAKEIHKRLKAALSHMLAGNNRKLTVDYLVENFDISEAQAYRDVQATFKLYGDVNRVEKEGWKFILSEFAMEMFKQAKTNKDIEGMDRALNKLIRITGVTQEDGFDPAMLQQHIIKISISGDSKKLIKGLTASGKVNLDDLWPTEEIEAEILSSEEGDQES